MNVASSVYRASADHASVQQEWDSGRWVTAHCANMTGGRVTKGTGRWQLIALILPNFKLSENCRIILFLSENFHPKMQNLELSTSIKKK